MPPPIKVPAMLVKGWQPNTFVSTPISGDVATLDADDVWTYGGYFENMFPAETRQQPFQHGVAHNYTKTNPFPSTYIHVFVLVPTCVPTQIRW